MEASTGAAAQRPLQPRVDPEVEKLFRAVIKLGGSDLHLRTNSPPYVRVRGTVLPLNRPPLERSEIERICFSVMDERNRRIFDDTGGADFAYMLDHEGETWRFRVNLMQHVGEVGLVARLVNNFVPDFEGLNLPPVIEQLCKFPQGMILLAGVTGSGKSTTIASMLNWMNHNFRKHILTLEDPIEFVFKQELCLITQREVGVDVKDFEIGMKHAVREDPDVMLVGEMRDRETFSTAMHAAETGHLVFGTIHSSSAATTIGRILSLFPQEAHDAVRSSLAFNLNGVVAQKLVPTIVDEPKRVPIVEIMIMNPSMRKLILEHDDEKIPDAIRIGKGDGMQLFNDSLHNFFNRKIISKSMALSVSPNPEQLQMMLKGIDVRASSML